MLVSPNVAVLMMLDVVFLDSNNNVKLGDFGLSKIIRSHDFASTYVGTPYYMSPELAGNERYTSASDVWSLGCIIYELCTLEVPFNARSHIELFQKIRLGKFRAIPPVYSQELQKVIASCLQTNPNSRPTAAQLLDLPIVCVVRKQQDAVVLHKDLQKKSKDLEAQAKAMHDEIDAKLRREWELKARLEIDKQVAVAKADLIAQFDAAVAAKAEILYQAKIKEFESQNSSARSSLSGQTAVGSANADLTPPCEPAVDRSYLMSADLGANLTQLSITSDSPAMTAAPGLRPGRPTRTPFTRAHTVAVNAQVTSVPSFEMQDCFSPMDVHMASPSPASITSLNLSPRRNGTISDINNRRMTTNIFVAGSDNSNTLDPAKRWIATSINDLDSDTDTIADPSDDEQSEREPQDLTMASPSRVAPKRDAQGDTKQKVSAVPGSKRPSRPSFAREKTAPANMKRFTSAPSLFPSGTNTLASVAPTSTSASPTRTTRARPVSAVPIAASSPTRKPTVSESPSRARSRIPDSTSSSPRKAGLNPFRSKKAATAPTTVAEDGKAPPQLRGTTNHGGVHGRTLVELAQARAGGIDRSMALTAGENRYTSPVKGGDNGPLWDPERDEMPSPFLARGRTIRGIVGGLR